MSLFNDPVALAVALEKAGKIDTEARKRVEERNAERPAKQRERNAPDAVRFVSRLGLTVSGGAKPLTEDDIAKLIAAASGVPYLKIDPIELTIEVVARTIPKPYALKHLLLPLYERNGEIVMAVANPFDHEPTEGVRRAIERPLSLVVAAPSDIERIIHEFFGISASVDGAERSMGGPSIDLGNLEQLATITGVDQIGSDDAHIKNAVEYLFNYAFELRASDIHLEPKRESCVVRFRIDGLLHDVYQMPKGVYQAVGSRIKMLGRLNIAEKRRPQDGRIRIERGDDKKGAELRLSTMPTAFGEKLVLRVLRPELLLVDMDNLGFFAEDLIKLERCLNQPHGIVLVTGPTGSGKTTTLYSALSQLASTEKNIVTVEDPIENIVDEFNQVAVQPTIGLTFANSLRTILRQDPDIIMIGEIRDQETASNAVQAALTGHLVLSTLHTNDASSAVTRLLDLGVKPFQINAALVGVVAQRLMRTVCEYCVEPVEVPRQRLAQFGIKVRKDSVTLREGKGCDQCRYTGYMGRTSVYEVMEINDTIRHLIGAEASAQEIRAAALKNGMTPLREVAAKKALKGITTIAELVKISYL
jgi:general secretion pathway protein E